MRRFLLVVVLFASTALLVSSEGLTQPPGGKSGKSGAKGPPRMELGQVLPPPLVAELNLTPEQEKELDDLKKEVKAKLEKLLTAEQKKKVENFRPRGQGGPGGSGGPGGPGGNGAKGGKGAPSGDKGGKSGDRPDRPPIEKD